MTSGRWQDLYQSNQDTIRRSLAQRGAPQPAPTDGRTGPFPLTGAPKATSARADAGSPGTRMVYSGPQGSRPYRMYVPPGRTGPLPLVMLLHGCTQDAAAIAAGTRMNAHADTHGFAVVYPEQTSAGNTNGCWNWFLPEHQRRGVGEPAILAGIAQDVLSGRSGATVDPSRVYVAGMSAGAGMATVLAATYPDLIAGLGLHSGLVFQAANNVSGGFTVMRRGAADPAASARAAFASMGPYARVMPMVIVHGTADRTVAPINGDQAVQQWRETNRLAGAQLSAERPSRQETGRVPGGYAYTVRRWDDGSRPVVEYWQVEGLGHAWSGGSTAGSFTDPRGPNASEAMWRFFSAQH
jgi:poly(hydroxyalkanoate) depolymerase family esterase